MNIVGEYAGKNYVPTYLHGDQSANDGGFSSHVRKLTLDPRNHIANALYKMSRWGITALQDGYVPPFEFALPVVDSNQGLANAEFHKLEWRVLWQDVGSRRSNSNARGMEMNSLHLGLNPSALMYGASYKWMYLRVQCQIHAAARL